MCDSRGIDIEWLALRIPIREVPVSDLGPETGCLQFLSVLLRPGYIPGQYLELCNVPPKSFPIHSLAFVPPSVVSFEPIAMMAWR